MANIPVEIIQTIFLELCSPSTRFPLRRKERRLVVTHICSQWRAIALSTPTLWASFSIYVWSSRFPPQRLDPIRAWISRSSQSTLSFRFYGSTWDPEMVTNLVFPVIHRCSLLKLRLNTTTLNRLLTFPPNSLCSLQSISLTVEENAPDPTPIATVFQSCPKLHKFSLTTFIFPKHLKIANFNVPWHQLTILRLDSSPILAHECLDVVCMCTALRECRVSVSPMDSISIQKIMDLSHHPVVLSSLHTLRIEFCGEENDNFVFLHALRLPRLRKFQPELSEPFESQEWAVHPTPGLLSVLQSVSCDALQELDLSVFPVYESFFETLAGMLNLTTLWLNDDSHHSPGIMRGLGEGTIGPRLKTLHFGFISSPEFVFDILEARVAAARANTDIAAFASVTTLDAGGEMIDEARLLALTETGMEIKFCCDT